MTAADERWALLDGTLPMLIGGKLVEGAGASDIVSSRDKRVIGRYAVPDDEQVDEAVAAAAAASTGDWARMTGVDRGRVLLEIAEVMERHQKDFEFLDAVDIGKPVTGVRYSDMPVSLEALSYFAGRAQSLAGVSADIGVPGVDHRSRLEPYGVVLEVLPWNGPLWTGVQRMAAILAAGNVAIIKPASIASASFLHLGRLIADLLPPGVLTVLPGPGGRVGGRLVTHPDVAMVSLTGGTETGARVLRDTADRIKPVSLELGGKNPNLVLDDADLDVAAQWSVMGAFANSGQICVCGSRILVQASVYDAFLERFLEGAARLEVGDPLLESTTTGPVVGEEHYDAVWGYIDQALAAGDGELLAGGVRYEDERANGWYVPPTVLAGVDPSCTIAREEVFGPVVTITPFDGIDEALAIANDTPYGLASGVFTQSIDRAAKVADGLQAGQVYVNQWFSPGGTRAPSQGYKQSGLGGVGIEKYLRVKNIFTRHG